MLLPGRRIPRSVAVEYHLGMSTETVSKKLFTVDEFYRMWDTGILPEDGRFELIRGEIIEMPKPKPPHSGTVNRLTQLFSVTLGKAVIVSVQNPLGIDRYSEPQPDLVLLKPRADFYAESHPMPEDVLLAVEISHTTVYYDSKIKAPLYAEAEIAEYWQLDVQKNVLVVRTNPVNGEYRDVNVFRRGQTISLQTLPSVSFSLDEILV